MTRSKTSASSQAKAQVFSTKPKENFGEFYYHGYRFYDAGLGRWLNRDPIEERGGVNLYGFVGNDGVNRLDYLGMEVRVFKNPGSGKYRAQAGHFFDPNAPSFVRDVKRKFSDSQINVNLYVGTRRAHTEDDISSWSAKRASEVYDKIFVFVIAHGQINGENYSGDDTVSHSERVRKGHYFAMDENVQSDKLFGDLKRMPEQYGTLLCEGASCYFNPLYKHKWSGGEPAILTPMDDTSNFDLRADKVYKEEAFGGMTRFVDRLEFSVNMEKDCEIAIGLFIGR